MPYSPDPRDWSQDDWIDREFVDYTLTSNERKALDTIARNLREGTYHDRENCFQHMQFLEHLSNKLKDVIANERSVGKANWDIERAQKGIKTLYQELSILHGQLRKR